jgi:hypothetical protein
MIVNLILENCAGCKKSDVRFLEGDSETDGSVLKYELCLDCDDKAHKMLDARESMASLIRLGVIF